MNYEIYTEPLVIIAGRKTFNNWKHIVPVGYINQTTSAVGKIDQYAIVSEKNKKISTIALSDLFVNGKLNCNLSKELFFDGKAGFTISEDGNPQEGDLIIIAALKEG